MERPCGFPYVLIGISCMMLCNILVLTVSEETGRGGKIRMVLELGIENEPKASSINSSSNVLVCSTFELKAQPVW